MQGALESHVVCEHSITMKTTSITPTLRESWQWANLMPLPAAKSNCHTCGHQTLLPVEELKMPPAMDSPLGLQLEEDTSVLATNQWMLLAASEADSWKVRIPSLSIDRLKMQVNFQV